MEHWQEMASVMVDESIAPKGVKNERILEAMRKIPRHLFIPLEYREYAYLDSPLPIGRKQTISQPFIVAKMTELLEPAEGDRVLEIGTGSGYQAALLSEMGIQVTTIERIEELAAKAQALFQFMGYKIRILLGDGKAGYPEGAPYQGIIITAGVQKMEDSWLAQLAAGGRIVVPLITRSTPEVLYRLLVRQKTGTSARDYQDTWHDCCSFVPLLSGIEQSREMSKGF